MNSTKLCFVLLVLSALPYSHAAPFSFRGIKLPSIGDITSAIETVKNKGEELLEDAKETAKDAYKGMKTNLGDGATGIVHFGEDVATSVAKFLSSSAKNLLPGSQDEEDKTTADTESEPEGGAESKSNAEDKAEPEDNKNLCVIPLDLQRYLNHHRVVVGVTFFVCGALSGLACSYGLKGCKGRKKSKEGYKTLAEV
ncbi:hypothetical protein QR680_008409 [Steinernema hermaphroditum]|uniref:Uncharacterized protein n=1 Tax=Steinernema hermaphroditum TaxID=289476 RepID=A0AA39IIW4_9BILA|nr:hypothetical protein QR680_008409 [Steinernema hermaphroditum]